MLFSVCSIVPPQIQMYGTSYAQATQTEQAVVHLDHRLKCLALFLLGFSVCGWFCCGATGLSFMTLGWRFWRGSAVTACPWRYSPDQALRTRTDQILPVGFQQSFTNEIVIFGVSVLDQRPLHSLFVWVSGNIDLIHGARVQSGVIHNRG